MYAIILPFNILMRIFDVYLYEGEKILFRAGLAILKIKEKELSNLNDFER